jgi:hypothetical protein
MKKNRSGLRTPNTKFGIRHLASFPIDLPANKIDLYKWLIEMQHTDYISYSRSHIAMGSFFKEGVFNTVNVENIGNETIVQRYALEYHSSDHVQLYSSKTSAYVLRWFPATVGVPWEMKIRPVSANTSELVCLIGADFPSAFLKIAAWCNGFGGYFLRRHLHQEGKAFATDMEEKFR